MQRTVRRMASWGLVIGLAMPAMGKPAKKAAAAPVDLNQLSLRVTAMDTLYELDLSAGQLAVLRWEAAGTAGIPPQPAKGFPKLAAALKDFHDALLQGKDDQEIAKLRNQVIDLVTANEDKLNDEVAPTAAARNEAVAVCEQLKASQIAAYLAQHADEVGDPVERMVEAVAEVHGADAGDQAAEIEQASGDVARMVAGMDDAKAMGVAEKVAGWLRENAPQADDSEAGQAALEKSAQATLGVVPPMLVLHHWMEMELVTLLSNPELVGAIDEMQAARQATP